MVVQPVSTQGLSIHKENTYPQRDSGVRFNSLKVSEKTLGMTEAQYL